MSQLDLLLLTLPPNWLDDPPAAPAILKSAVRSKGFTCQFLDLSLYSYKNVFNKNYRQYQDWCQIFPATYDLTQASSTHLDLLYQAVEMCVNQVAEISPKVVGLSVFSEWQHRFSFLLCQHIRSVSPDIKIIMGGGGGSIAARGLEYFSRISYFEKNTNYIDFMMSRRLIDFGVINDGEEELVTILQNLESYESHLTPREVDFKARLLPDYDDYCLEDYFYINDQKKLLIRGSKGCVRQCIFCNEHRTYSKFLHNEGQKIVEEMIELSNRYGIRKFQFTDSLVNGPLQSFREMIAGLAEYNTNNPEKALVWNGNYICRSNNNMSDYDYANLQRSGAHGLTIGAESGSDRVLKEMKKNTTVSDLLYEIDKFKQFDISCYLLFMVGFYNETWEDFLATICLLKKIQPYVASGTVDSVRAGYGFLISDWSYYQKDDFEIDPTNQLNWTYKKNPDATFNERCRRRVIFQEVCDDLGIPVSYAHADLQILENMCNNRFNIKSLDSISAHN